LAIAREESAGDRMKIFVAGATGAIGLPLVRALREHGHDVIGMTRTERGVDLLRELGAAGSMTDAFDARAVRIAIESAAPDVVIDQLSSLPANPAEILNAIPGDTRLHAEGGENLLDAAAASGVGRYILQSKGFYADAPDGELADESAKLRYQAPGVLGEATRAMGAYEDSVLSSPLDGVVLRYGFFYGPRTWYWPGGGSAEQARRGEGLIVGEGNAVWSFVHIDDAVAATVAALTAEPGIYNVVDDDPLPVSDLLRAFARWVEAPAPQRVSVEDALEAAGAEAVYFHTRLTGAANTRAKAKLGFTPRSLAWKSLLGED
jgi:2-alkyl-3-oxoalkanoate reductase